MRAPTIARSLGRLVLSLAVLGALVRPVPVAAQTQSAQPSLAEIARKEAERRKTTKDAKKVITTKDLPESARRPASAPAAAADGTQSGGEQKPAPGGDTASTASTASSGQGDEAAWRARITQAREALRRNETFQEALQTRVNALGNDFRNSGDSAQQAKVTQDRLKALEDLERVKADVELSKKQIADIEEEARKAGVPPGWLR